VGVNCCEFVDKKHTNKNFDAWSKLIPSNQYQAVDKIIQTISKQQEMKEE